MATPRKPTGTHKKRGPKPKSPSGPGVMVSARLPPEDKQALIDTYGTASAGIVALIRQWRQSPK